MAVDTAGRYVGTTAIKDNEAHQAERAYRDQLAARAGLDYDGRMALPPPLERDAARFGGRRRQRKGGDYDWLYELHPDEQTRIRANWMTPHGGFSPDELEEHMPVHEWLSLTRRIDMSRAIARGRHINRNRFGNVDPDKVLLHGERIGRHREKADDDEPGRCHFFTDDDGVVHPIRSTCGHEGKRMAAMSSAEHERATGMADEKF